MKMNTEHWWIDTDKGKLKYSEKNLSQSTVSTINLTRTNPEPNPHLRGDCLSYGKAYLKVAVIIIIIILRSNSYHAVNALLLYYKTNQLML